MLQCTVNNKSFLTNVYRADFVPKDTRPAYSPDFNIIESLNEHLKQAVCTAHPTTRAELCTTIHNAWNSIDAETIRKLYRSLPERMTQCKQRGGALTDY